MPKAGTDLYEKRSHQQDASLAKVVLTQVARRRSNDRSSSGIQKIVSDIESMERSKPNQDSKGKAVVAAEKDSDGEVLIAFAGCEKTDAEWILDSDVRHVLGLKRNLSSLSTLDLKGYKYSGGGGILKVTKGSLVMMKADIKTTNLYHLYGTTITGFNTSVHTTQEILDYVHSDLWGPSQEASLGGAYYMMTIIDDYSRRVWYYFLKHKSEGFSTFKQWKAMVEKQTEREVKKLHTENGLEFCSKMSDGIGIQKCKVTELPFFCSYVEAVAVGRGGGGGQRWVEATTSGGRGGQRWVEAAVGDGQWWVDAAAIGGGRRWWVGDGQRRVDAVGGGSKRRRRWVEAVGGGSTRWRRSAGGRRGGGGRRWVDAVAAVGGGSTRWRRSTVGRSGGRR
ncbi:hypothetical protein OSB04_031923 [Centaurea solstitialis]|uniref:Integrase catalytic domain-containing protein n=1 Tax=Centaurea solstitialis TaxID=347529 RepID=A0AA38SAH3_9ASTR|nr:hypothetical protein OSB04_031923 [Centaurea solstitialis]